MADGTPVLERVFSQEDTLEAVLRDTDKRLVELERKSNQIATEGPGEITVLAVDQLIYPPPVGIRAWVIEAQLWFVPGAGGGGVGPQGSWVPE